MVLDKETKCDRTKCKHYEKSILQLIDKKDHETLQRCVTCKFFNRKNNFERKEENES